MTERVNNFFVTFHKVFWSSHLLCWHRKKYLRAQLSVNGFSVFCAKCRRRRFTVVYTRGF